MPVDRSRGDKRFAEVAAVLGVPDAAVLAEIGREGLERFSYKQLFESSRKLGLTGISRLNKGALAARLWEALEQVGALQKPVVEEAGHTVLSHKFEQGEKGKGASEDIPWSYDWDRVTAAAVDPDRMFVYWEVTQAAIDRARKQLGAAGDGAWLNLRVYDTTGRIFDGTNAHGYFDHGLSPHDRQWFFHIGKPTSEHFVEIGMKSHEGFFAKIARSGRVEFPRSEPASWTEPEWLTVRASVGAVEYAGRGAPGHPGEGAWGGGGPGGPGGFGGSQVQRGGWEIRHHPWEELVRYSQQSGYERIEWEQYFNEGVPEEFRTFEWEGPHEMTAWEAGPFTYEVEAPPPVREAFVGGTHIYRVGGRTHIIYGPWQVTIRGIEAHQERRVLARWEVYRSWISSEGREVRVQVPADGELLAGSSGRLGSSERVWLGASDKRLGGASEVFYMGASEVRLRGSSERLFAAASEKMLRGASERMFAASSELRFQGATENLLRGSSELSWKGASESMLKGASEKMFGAGSEGRLGSSEHARAQGGAVENGTSAYPSSLKGDENETSPTNGHSRNGSHQG